MLAGTGGSAVLGSGSGLGSKVKTHLTALKIAAVLGVESLLGILVGVEVDVAEATGPAALLVGDDTGTGETLEVLELLVEDVVINAPAEVAAPEGGALLLAVLNSLVLLGLGLLSLLLSLSLLGGLSLLLGRLGRSLLGRLLLLRRVRVRAGVVGILLRLSRIG